MNYLAENLRYLMWDSEKARSEWASRLAARMHWKVDRADELLDKGNATPEELQELQGEFALTAEDLRLGRLVLGLGEVRLLAENVRYITDALPHGEQASLATRVGVSVSTVSRWRSGTHRPTGKKLRALLRALELPPDTDLGSEALFLSRLPVDLMGKKMWLRDQIEALPPEEVRELFPALYRMLK